MKLVSRKVAALTFSLICAIHVNPSLFAQSVEENWWKNAENRWQLTAVDSKTQVDTVSPAVRAQRIAFWMKPLLNQPLITITNQEFLPGLIDDRPPEVRSVKGSPSVWVVAKFEGFHVYATDPDDKLLYTEMNMRVVSVIKVPKDLQISSGSLLDVNTAGGRLRTAAGEVHSYALKRHTYSPQPGRTYILQLLYDSKYNILSTYSRWDVTSGTVQPDDERGIAMASEGTSILKGMPVAKAITYLQSAIPDEPNDQ